MRLQEYPILPALQPYVKLICTMDCDEDADTHHICVLPDTCGELFINYTSSPLAIIGNELYQRSMVTFRMSRPMEVQMRKGSGCMAICFHPGMACRFIHLPMQELTDTITPMADIWNATAIEDKLANAADGHTRVALLQEYLLQQLANSTDDPQIAYCLQLVQLSTGTLSAAQLAERAGIGQRQLLRKFRQYVGLSPKEYLGVNRFIRSLEHLKKYPACSLTDVAYESGYYDQAHFIRDYNAYSGYTPREVALSGHILY